MVVFNSLLPNLSNGKAESHETGGTGVEAYRKHVDERAQESVVQNHNAEQVNELVELLREPPSGEESVLLDLLTERVPAGVDEAAYVKAAYLAAIAKGETSSPLIDSRKRPNSLEPC